MLSAKDLNIGDIVARKRTDIMWLVISKQQPLLGGRGRPIVQLMDIFTFEVFNVQNKLDDNIIRIAGNRV